MRVPKPLNGQCQLDDGAGVLLVEQHVRQALKIADRVYVLERGNIALMGTTREVRGRLEEIEVAYLSSNG